MMGRAPQGKRHGVAGSDPLAVAEQVGCLPGGRLRVERGRRGDTVPDGPGTWSAASSRKDRGSGAGPPRLAAASAAASATATAPLVPSGWACVTSAARIACSRAAPGSLQNQAPSGAARIAAPLPRLPCPSNRAQACTPHVPGSAASLGSRTLIPRP